MCALQINICTCVQLLHLLVFCYRYDLQVNNFSKDWSDGKVFCAVLHRHRPDIIDYSSVESNSPQQNLELAFDTAYDQLEVEKLLDPEGEHGYCFCFIL